MPATNHTTDAADEAHGGFIVEDGIEWYRIDDYDRLDPFLINVVTPDDQWIYVSSSGALTAGRQRAEHALFPYETDDRLHRSGGRSGPVTLVRVDGGQEVWEPFACHTPLGTVRRSVAKTSVGDRLRFEEYHPGFGLTFRYTWASAGEFGLVRRCELLLDDGRPTAEIELLDGLVNLLPAGVELLTQQTASTLVDAYRRSEFDERSGLALFTLEALISDRADPAEALRASVVWSQGLDGATVSLSERQIGCFRSGRALEPGHLVRGSKGAYLLSGSFTLTSGAPLPWLLAADVQQDHLAIARLGDRMSRWSDATSEVGAAIDEARSGLVAIVEEADGLQETADRRVAVHHFANVLFNCMRGGSFLEDHQVELADVDRFIHSRNRTVHARFATAVEGLRPVVELDELRQAVTADADLYRLVSEYLPLTFSRRHGDPSRPWNTFDIPARAETGHPAMGYEGNWRDIFQNWEALVHSFPRYTESVISKFLNASTIDGHNPYRISHTGIDWEIPEDGTWSNFGYWGDHQIVYLHRLLESADRFQTGLLESKLDQCLYSYGDVPYCIRPYAELVSDPKNTLEFDHQRQEAIDERIQSIGSDGRLLPATEFGTPADGPDIDPDIDPDTGDVHKASLAEKLLVPALAKLSNFVAGGGIWLNTQRPEWNDANNALVGNGVSTVTLFHLRDYLSFLDGLLGRATTMHVPIGEPVVSWMRGIEAAFEAHAEMVGSSGGVGRITDVSRRDLLDRLGGAFSRYRSDVYLNGLGLPSPVAVDRLRQLIALVLRHLEAGTAAARRPDGLVHSYWSLDLQPQGDGGLATATLEPLYEMLEGQVAALSSPSVDPPTALGLIDALFDGPLYRADQESFILYPNRPLPSFTEKNIVPSAAMGSAMVSQVNADRGLASCDVDGMVRFAADLASPRRLDAELAELDLDDDARSQILAAYEAVFRHRSFTGRSQTMYRYEGLGSIYWHMVSKLLFAIQERVAAVSAAGGDEAMVVELAERYRRVRQGLGYLKNVSAHGSFPTDPHSHTPANTGAQQPGMTGQVKEGVLIRWGELGVRVEQGCVQFRPLLLDRSEFLLEARPWPPLGRDAVLEVDTFGFTYCGVPVVYHLVAADVDPWTRVSLADGGQTVGGPVLDLATSQTLFARTGRIARIDVGIPEP